MVKTMRVGGIVALERFDAMKERFVSRKDLAGNKGVLAEMALSGSCEQDRAGCLDIKSGLARRKHASGSSRAVSGF